MNHAKHIVSGAAAFLMLGLVACGGRSSEPAPVPQKASYENPASGDFRLLLNAKDSTATRVVLDLVGPAGLSGRGISFALAQAGGKGAAWVKRSAEDPYFVRCGFDLGTGARQFALARVDADGILHVSFNQKGDGGTPLAFGPTVVLASMTLEVPEGSPLPTLSAPGGLLVWVEREENVNGTKAVRQILESVPLSVGRLAMVAAQ